MFLVDSSLPLVPIGYIRFLRTKGISKPLTSDFTDDSIDGYYEFLFQNVGQLTALSALERVKTDRLDARKLATYYQKGLLTAVHVPELEDEMDRAVLRTREFVKRQLQETKRYILSSCRKIGWNYRQESKKEKESYWTDAHKSWLVKKVQDAPASVRFNLNLLIANMDMLEQRMGDYERQIVELAESEKYQKRVRALICYRGIDYHSAMTLVCEIGDIRRFSHPKYLVSYAGMDICEYSSGGKERKLKMTKMGNPHIRTTVIESNQLFGLPPRISTHLKRRRKKCEQQYIEIADRCMMRIYKKSSRLVHRTKVNNKIKLLPGFEWVEV